MKILLVFGSAAARDWWLRYGPYSLRDSTLQPMQQKITFHNGGVGPVTVDTAVVTSLSEMRSCQPGMHYDLVMEHLSLDAVLRANDLLRIEWDHFARACLLVR